MQLIGVVCPKCRGPVEYNGNYYCINEDRCGWVFDTERGKVRPFLEGLRRAAVQAGDDKYVERIDFYLKPMQEQDLHSGD